MESGAFNPLTIIGQIREKIDTHDETEYNYLVRLPYVQLFTLLDNTSIHGVSIDDKKKIQIIILKALIKKHLLLLDQNELAKLTMLYSQKIRKMPILFVRYPELLFLNNFFKYWLCRKPAEVKNFMKLIIKKHEELTPEDKFKLIFITYILTSDLHKPIKSKIGDNLIVIFDEFISKFSSIKKTYPNIPLNFDETKYDAIKNHQQLKLLRELVKQSEIFTNICQGTYNNVITVEQLLNLELFDSNPNHIIEAFKYQYNSLLEIPEVVDVYDRVKNISHKLTSSYPYINQLQIIHQILQLCNILQIVKHEHIINFNLNISTNETISTNLNKFLITYKLEKLTYDNPESILYKMIMESLYNDPDVMELDQEQNIIMTELILSDDLSKLVDSIFVILTNNQIIKLFDSLNMSIPNIDHEKKRIILLLRILRKLLNEYTFEYIAQLRTLIDFIVPAILLLQTVDSEKIISLITDIKNIYINLKTSCCVNDKHIYELYKINNNLLDLFTSETIDIILNNIKRATPQTDALKRLIMFVSIKLIKKRYEILDIFNKSLDELSLQIHHNYLTDNQNMILAKYYPGNFENDILTFELPRDNGKINNLIILIKLILLSDNINNGAGKYDQLIFNEKKMLHINVQLIILLELSRILNPPLNIIQVLNIIDQSLINKLYIENRVELIYDILKQLDNGQITNIFTKLDGTDMICIKRNEITNKYKHIFKQRLLINKIIYDISNNETLLPEQEINIINCFYKKVLVKIGYYLAPSTCSKDILYDLLYNQTLLLLTQLVNIFKLLTNVDINIEENQMQLLINILTDKIPEFQRKLAELPQQPIKLSVKQYLTTLKSFTTPAQITTTTMINEIENNYDREYATKNTELETYIAENKPNINKLQLYNNYSTYLEQLYKFFNIFITNLKPIQQPARTGKKSVAVQTRQQPVNIEQDKAILSGIIYKLLEQINIDKQFQHDKKLELIYQCVMSLYEFVQKPDLKPNKQQEIHTNFVHLKNEIDELRDTVLTDINRIKQNIHNIYIDKSNIQNKYLTIFNDRIPNFVVLNRCTHDNLDVENIKLKSYVTALLFLIKPLNRFKYINKQLLDDDNVMTKMDFEKEFNLLNDEITHLSSSVIELERGSAKLLEWQLMPWNKSPTLHEIEQGVPATSTIGINRELFFRILCGANNDIHILSSKIEDQLREIIDLDNNNYIIVNININPDCQKQHVNLQELYLDIILYNHTNNEFQTITLSFHNFIDRNGNLPDDADYVYGKNKTHAHLGLRDERDVQHAHMIVKVSRNIDKRSFILNFAFTTILPNCQSSNLDPLKDGSKDMNMGNQLRHISRIIATSLFSVTESIVNKENKGTLLQTGAGNNYKLFNIETKLSNIPNNEIDVNAADAYMYIFNILPLFIKFVCTGDYKIAHKINMPFSSIAMNYKYYICKNAVTYEKYKEYKNKYVNLKRMNR